MTGQSHAMEIRALAVCVVLALTMPAVVHASSRAAPVAVQAPAQSSLRAAQSATPAPVRDALPRTIAASASALSNPDAVCYRPAAATADCFVTWSSISTSAPASQYVISMTVEIGGRLRAYHTGFFQNSMYIPPEMTDSGYKVTCGAPGSGGMAEFGRVYSYTVRARYTDSSISMNTGSVLCPADIVPAWLPLVRR
jgi:hypothetical protein